MTRDTLDRLLPARLLPTSTRAPSASDTLGRAPVGLLLHGQMTGFGGPPAKAAGPLTPACSRRRCRPRLAPRERDPAAKALGCPRPTGASAPRCPFEHPARAAPVRRLGRRRLRLSRPLPAGMPEGRPWADCRPRPCPLPEGKGASFGLGLACRSLAAVATHERTREREPFETSGSSMSSAARSGELAVLVVDRDPIAAVTSRKVKAPGRFGMSGNRDETRTRTKGLRSPCAPAPRARHAVSAETLLRYPHHLCYRTQPPVPDGASNRCGSTAACSDRPKPA